MCLYGGPQNSIGIKIKGEHSSSCLSYEEAPQILSRDIASVGILKAPSHIRRLFSCTESIQKQTCDVVGKGQKVVDRHSSRLKLHGLEEEETLFGKARL